MTFYLKKWFLTKFLFTYIFLFSASLPVHIFFQIKSSLCCASFVVHVKFNFLHKNFITFWTFEVSFKVTVLLLVPMSIDLISKIFAATCSTWIRSFSRMHSQVLLQKSLHCKFFVAVRARIRLDSFVNCIYMLHENILLPIALSTVLAIESFLFYVSLIDVIKKFTFESILITAKILK